MPNGPDYDSLAIQWWFHWRNHSSTEGRQELLDWRVARVGQPGWDDTKFRAALARFKPAQTKPWDPAEAAADIGRVLGADIGLWGKAQQAVESWLAGGWRGLMASWQTPVDVRPGGVALQLAGRPLPDPDAELAAFLDPAAEANFDLSLWMGAAKDSWLIGQHDLLPPDTDLEAWELEEGPRVIKWIVWYLAAAAHGNWNKETMAGVWQNTSDLARPPWDFVNYMESTVKSPPQAAQDEMASDPVRAKQFVAALAEAFLASYGYQLPSPADYWTPEQLERIPPESLQLVTELMATMGQFSQGRFAELYAWVAERLGFRQADESWYSIQLAAQGDLSAGDARAAFGDKYGSQLSAWITDRLLTPDDRMVVEFQAAVKLLEPMLAAEDILAVSTQMGMMATLWGHDMADRPLADQLSFGDWLIGPGTRLFQGRMDLAIVTDEEERAEAASGLRQAGQMAAAMLVERGIAPEAAVSLAAVLATGQRGSVAESLQSLAAVIPALNEAGVTATGVQIDFLAELGAAGLVDQRVIQLQAVAQRQDAVGEMARATLAGQIDPRVGLQFFADIGAIDPTLAPELFEEELVSPGFAEALRTFAAAQSTKLSPADLASLRAGIFAQAENLEAEFLQSIETQKQAGLLGPALDEPALRARVTAGLEAELAAVEQVEGELAEVGPLDIQARFRRELGPALEAATEAQLAPLRVPFLEARVGADVRAFAARRRPPQRFRPFRVQRR